MSHYETSLLTRVVSSNYMKCARVNAYSAIIDVFTEERDRTIDEWNDRLTEQGL